VKSVTPPPDKGNPYPIGYVNLPNGQVMVTCEQNDWIYTPDTPPQDEWRPTVSSVVYNPADDTYTLTGTQISGLINGADEGDDMTMAENYPIVWLTDDAGNVYYCRSFNFSNMTPSKGDTPETCQFTLPPGLPNGTYGLYVSAVGVQSKASIAFTVGVGGKADGSTGTSGSTGGTAGSAAGGAGSAVGSAGTQSSMGTAGNAGAAGNGGSLNRSGSGGAGATTAGPAGTTGAPAAQGTGGTSGSAAKTKSGCGCRVAGESSRSAGWISMSLLGLAGLRARRPRGSKTRRPRTR
jgi:MYXO-CTERM domain-containing protein